MELLSSAEKIRSNAQLWRKYLINEEFAGQQISADTKGYSTTDHAAQTLHNLKILTEQLNSVFKQKDPAFSVGFTRNIVLDTLVNQSFEPSKLSYSVADKSGRLADVIERSTKHANTVLIYPDGPTEVEQLVSEFVEDSNSRLKQIDQAHTTYLEAQEEN